MRITAKGRVTIPAALRARAGLLPNTQVTIDWDGTAIRIAPVPVPPPPGHGEALVAHLRRHAHLVSIPPEAPTRDHEPAPEP
jgi:AbrB family looped-hinge helix DNA binding protein